MSKTATKLIDSRGFYRSLEIFPGLVTWCFLIFPVVLSLWQPLWVAYFIIAFDLFWLIKALRLSFYLLRGYNRLHLDESIHWRSRLRALNDLPEALAEVQGQLQQLLKDNPRAKRWGLLLPGDRSDHLRYTQLHRWQKELQTISTREASLLDPRQLRNAVIIATFNEDFSILEASIKALMEVDYPLKQIMLIIAYEERGGAEVEASAKKLIELYGEEFGYAKAIKHPNTAGEPKTKGANITYAGRILTKDIEAEGIDPEMVIVTTLDADHQPSRNYFAHLSFSYASDPNRIHKSYQPVPMFYNNIWDAPAPMRVIATGNSFWMLVETMRPHRLRNFAAHAQSLRTLIDTDYWSTTSIVEDGHQYWRTYFTYDGDHQVVPLYAPIYQDAVLAATYPRTFQAQYLQLRRWAWGISDFAYVVTGALKNNRIKWSNKLAQIGRLFEGHFSWATAPLILSFVAWMPLLLNRSFGDQVLAHQLPVIAGRLQALAGLGLIITVFISLISLPPRPPHHKRTRIIAMMAQWVLLPFTAIIFSAFAAIDAQTRLMFGKYLDFRVTEKARKLRGKL